MSNELKVLSLFSGCGGMDLGFEGGFDVPVESVANQDWINKKVDNERVELKKLPFKTIFANDIRPGAKAAWQSYFGKRDSKNLNGIYHLGSIVDFVKNGELESFKGNVDIVTGGFPCQDFSIAGKRKGFKSHKSHSGKILDSADDPSSENRGMLYMWMREVINITRPKMFIAENVKGLVSLDNVKEIIEKDFSNIGENGYLVVPVRVLHAAEYGVAQNRERVFFLGFNKKYLTEEALKALSKEVLPNEFDPYPVKTHLLNSNNTQELFPNGNQPKELLATVTVQQTLRGLLEPEEATDLSQKTYSKAKWYGKHCQGQTEVNMDGIAPTIRSEHHGNIEFRRLSPENGGRNKEEFENGLQQRRLTVRECARIQTFPDDYEFVKKDKNKALNVSGSEAYKLIGNAVPPLLAYHIAKRIESLWPKFFK